MTDGKTVFLSYSSDDALFVQKIVDMLKEMNVPYWKAPEMIPAGSNYAREIPRAIKGCEVFLMVVSKAAQESIWVEKELDSAINNRKIIVPIKIDDEPLNDVYKFYLSNVQMISFNDDREAVMSFLKEQLKNIIGIDKTEPEETRPQAAKQEENVPKAEEKEPEVQNVQAAEGKESEAQNIQAKELEESVPQEQLTDEQKHLKDRIRRSNALTQNKAPEECKACHGGLRIISRGVYQCVECGMENYDYLQTVKRYLEKHGATNSVIIERDTGIPRKVIENFVKEDYLVRINLDSWWD